MRVVRSQKREISKVQILEAISVVRVGNLQAVMSLN
jgi:hypothetical protein